MSTIEKVKIRKAQTSSAEKIQACWRGHRARRRLRSAKKQFEAIFLETEQTARDKITSMNSTPLPRTTLLWRSDALCTCAPPLILNDWELQSYLRQIKQPKHKIDVEKEVSKDNDFGESEPPLDFMSEDKTEEEMSGLPVVSVKGHELLRTDDIAIIALNETLDYECYLADPAVSGGGEVNETAKLGTPGRRVATYSPSKSKRGTSTRNIMSTDTAPESPLLPVLSRKSVFSTKKYPRTDNNERLHTMPEKESETSVFAKPVSTSTPKTSTEVPHMVSVGVNKPYIPPVQHTSVPVYPIQQESNRPRPPIISDVPSPLPRGTMLGGTGAKRITGEDSSRISRLEKELADMKNIIHSTPFVAEPVVGTFDRFEARVARFLGSYADPNFEISTVPESERKLASPEPTREKVEQELAWVKEAMRSRRKYLKKKGK